MGEVVIDQMKRLSDYRSNCIKCDTSVLSALAKLEEVRDKVLFVLDDEDRLVASLTDGDIRRTILKGVPLSASAVDFACAEPFAVVEGDEEPAKEAFDKLALGAIPIVDANKSVVGLLVRNDKDRIEKNAISIPVVIMAGGKGTRLYPYTKILPKPLIPIDDIPISERIIRSFAEIGCTDFNMIVNYKGNMIKSYYNECEERYNIRFYDEDEPLGTGGGLRLIKDDVKETFILSNCDILILADIADIVRFHKENGNKATIVCSLKNFEIPYGVVHFSEGGEIESMEEKPQMSYFTNTGYYVLDKEVFDYIGDNERIGMPDILDRMRLSGLKVGVYPIGENSWLDMGQFDSMDTMERRLKEIEYNRDC